MKILLDLDDVLGNFTKSVCKVHNLSYERLEKLRLKNPGIWPLTEVLGMSSTEFWKPINRAGSKFWEEIEKFHWADSLINLAKEYSSNNWRIVSTPAFDARCYYGKRKWCQNLFGYATDKLILTQYKADLARPDAVLIDDREQTIIDFIGAGGKGIVFPTLGNSKHKHHKNPLSYVIPELEKLKGVLG